MTLNCIIVDDEPLAASLLKSYAERMVELNLVGIYHSAIEAMSAVRTGRIDLIFMDIQMPELSGIEFASIIPKRTHIIFTTAFEQYAIEGYKVDAIDYLLKPIAFDDFVRAVKKAHKLIEGEQQRSNLNSSRILYIKSDYKLVQVRLDDILYIEGEKDYVKVHIEGQQEPVMTLMNMKRIEEYLPSPEFIRTHRSFIAHMPKVQRIDKLRLLIGNEFIPISESYKQEILDFIDSHSIG